MCVGPESFKSYFSLEPDVPESGIAHPEGWTSGWCYWHIWPITVWLVSAERGFCVLLANTHSIQVSINHCVAPPYHPAFHLPFAAQTSSSGRLCCIIIFQTLLQSNLDLLFICLPLFYPAVPTHSYLKPPATTLSDNITFVRGSLKLFLINPFPVLMSFLTSSLAGRWISTAAPLMVLFKLIKGESVI